MTVTVLADLKLDPSNRDSFVAALAEMLPDTRAFEGCEGLEVIQDQDHAGHIVLIERWAQRSNHEAYMAWRTETGTLAAVAEMLTEAPVFTYCDAVDA